uniref:Uncharacterized protein n=1 Tax=Rhizophora mucronata TaxID=61149 RepID=A0A2P2QRP6_RHIMU
MTLAHTKNRPTLHHVVVRQKKCFQPI